MAGSLPAQVFGLPLEYVVFGAVLACTLLAAPLVLALASPQQHMRKRASKMHKRVTDKSTYKDSKDDLDNASLRREEGDKALPFLSRLVAGHALGKGLRDRIARSGFGLTAERYLAMNVLLFCATALVMTLVFGHNFLLALLLGIIVGLGLPHMVLNFAIGRRTKHFLTLFPDAIDLIVRGLRAGLPVTESIKMVAREIGEPVNQIFQTMTEKMALGVPLEKTLYETAAKYRITEFDFFVTSIVLQRETGGNLSEILNNLSEALRQRLMMRLKIKAMSSEAKASMYIISALPFVVMGGLLFTSPDYLNPLFYDYRGNMALAGAGFMLFTGIFIMTRMTKFEI